MTGFGDTPRTLEDFVRDTRTRLVALERRRGGGGETTPPPDPAASLGKGTTAQRNAVYPPPTNATEQASLANRQVVWYNTDKGWFERYYATTGTAGLTTPGLRAGAASGWYPEPGAGIYATLTRTTSQTGVSGNGLWILYDTIKASRGFTISLPTEYLMPPYAGDYEISASAVVSQTGANYFDLWFRVNGVTRRAETGTVYPHTNGYSRAVISPMVEYIPLGQDMRTLASSSSAGTVAANSPFFTVRYVGPPLA